MSTTRTADVDDFDLFVVRLSDQLDVSLDGASSEDRLVDDLGLDSVARFRLLVMLEDVAPHELPVELLDSLETLGDVWHWYANLAGQRAHAAAAGADTAAGASADTGADTAADAAAGVSAGTGADTAAEPGHGDRW